MDVITWSENLSVGVIAADGEGRETAGSVLNAPADYTGRRFKREEALSPADGDGQNFLFQ